MRLDLSVLMGLAADLGRGGDDFGRSLPPVLPRLGCSMGGSRNTVSLLMWS